MSFRIVLSALLVISLVDEARGHAHLVDPPSRNILSYRNHQEHSPHSYQAGGPARVRARSRGIWPTFKDPSSHGLCGDPRQNGPDVSIAEMKYMEPTDPQRVYVAGSIATFEVGISAHHMGHFEFRICDRVLDRSLASAEEGQDCLNTWILHRAPRSELCGSNYEGDCQPLNPNHPERWYLPPRDWNYEELNGPDWTMAHTYRMRFSIPADLRCERCTLQWYYATGNTCAYDEDYFLFDPGFRFFQFYKEPWATCEGHCCRSQGSFGEEFWNCADISVVNEGGAMRTTAAETTTTAELSTTSRVEDVSTTAMVLPSTTSQPEIQTTISVEVSSSTTEEPRSVSTTSADQSCTPAWEDCRSSRCCLDPSLTCYAKSRWYAACRSSCTPGDWRESSDNWSCDVLTPHSGSRAEDVSTTALVLPSTTTQPEIQATTSVELSSSTTEEPRSVSTTSADQSCTPAWEDCRSSRCCLDPSLTCYAKSRWYAACRSSCTPGDWRESSDNWSCDVLTPHSGSRAEDVSTTALVLPSTTTRPEIQTTTSVELSSSTTEQPRSVSTTSADLSCTSAWADCRSSRCCLDPSLTCYSKSRWWAACRPSCTPGDARDNWSCDVLTPHGGRRLRGP